MIYHVVSARPANGNPRLIRAQESWKALADAGKMRLLPMQMKRTARDIGDSRDLPLLRDILEVASPVIWLEGCLMLTNDDVILQPELIEEIEERLKRQPVICSGRLNLPDRQPDHGRDLFVMNWTWLKPRLSFKIPNFYLGEMEWDLVMGLMVRQSLGVETRSWDDFHKPSKAELPLGLVLHERHEPVWLKPEMKDSPAKWWNRLHARQWYADNGLKHLCTV